MVRLWPPVFRQLHGARPTPSKLRQSPFLRLSGVRLLTALMLILASIGATPSWAQDATADTGLPGSTLALNGLGSLLGGSQNAELLPPEQAFILTPGPVENGRLQLSWNIEPGYYMYRNKFAFEHLRDANQVEPGQAVTIADATAGKIKEDAYFGSVEVHRDRVDLWLDVAKLAPAQELQLRATSQGCADIGVCFPPQQEVFSVAFTTAMLASSATADGALIATTADAASTGSTGDGAANTSAIVPEQDRLAAYLASKGLPAIIALFFGLGLLLAFTPCVLPMIPILSSLIVGQGEQTTVSRSTLLSIIYVLAMALTYTLAGIAVGLTGSNVQIWLQNPWVLSFFAFLLVLLSLSMFGFYTLEMPQALQMKLTRVSNKQQGGTLGGAAIMGFLSALIVGPCVTAPLVGALIFIANTGDAVTGGLALFALSMGMGAPLILVGASCGHLLPRAGRWMDTTKAVFGVLMLAMAIWMLSRFAPAMVTMLLAAFLIIVSGIYLGATDSLKPEASGWQRLAKGGGVIALLYGSALLIGAFAGNQSLLRPLEGFAAKQSVASNTLIAGTGELHFTTIKSEADLEQALQQASSSKTPLILDFYADWCVSCKEMEAFTFTDPAVKSLMQQAILLRADVTANDALDKALLKRFGLFGPPGIIVFDPQGSELRNARVVGYMKARQFANHLDAFI